MLVFSRGIVQLGVGGGGGGADVSLQKNVAGQNFTFGLINASTGAAMTGATIVGFVSKDGGAQASCAGSFTELGHGMYNYVPTQAETNANHVGFLMTATSALPINLPFWTGGFHKNVAAQHYTYCLYSTSGIADPSATVTVYTSKDGGAQATGAGTNTNLGNGQYDYAPTQAETNGTSVSFMPTAANDFPTNITLFTVTP